MNKEFISAIDDLETKKNISKEVLIEAIEAAVAAAYKKNYGSNQNVRINIDRKTGEIEVYMQKRILDDSEVMNEYDELTLDEAREIDPKYQIGDVIESRITPRDFGRIAAQTAKQVVMQRIREAERGMVYDEFSEKKGSIVTGTVQRLNKNTIYVDLGHTEGKLSEKEQVKGEHFDINSRISVYVMDVKRTPKGPQVFLSRSHPGFVKELFRLEVPEIVDGTVEIKNLAREAGSRTKMAVLANDPDVDPVGACVGQRGIRVQAVVDELFGEKIDIIEWSDDISKLIKSALSPAKVEEVYINQAGQSAAVVVPDFQLSLAIGKEGQNVRLAAKLCNWKIDIKSRTQFEENGGEEAVLAEIEAENALFKEESVENGEDEGNDDNNENNSEETGGIEFITDDYGISFVESEGAGA